MQSPEKLEASLKELQHAIERERSLTTEAERRARDLQTKLDTVLRVGLSEKREGKGVLSAIAGPPQLCPCLSLSLAHFTELCQAVSRWHQSCQQCLQSSSRACLRNITV